MKRITRRSFLERSSAGVAIFAAGAPALARALGANDRVRVAVMGIHGRGRDHVAELLRIDGVEVAALIDPDSRTFASQAAAVAAKGGAPPRTEKDLRRVLEDRSIDALTIAAPNHWHALATIWGCQAGKDVYVEKPASHNVREGRLAVEAARRHNRIVQHGTQTRSSAEWVRAAAAVASGKYGKLLVARGLCYNPRDSIGEKPPSPPPAEVDFDLWLGPAPQQPHHANLVHYNWHWFWDFGSGDIGNQGVHQMDLARWGIPGATLPRSVQSLGGRFGYRDQAQTPNTQLAILDFGEVKLIFEVRGLPTGPYEGQKVGTMFHLTEGIISAGKFHPKGGGKPEPLPEVEGERRAGVEKGHFGNFIACVRSRRQPELAADILEGHYSSACCHLANVSYRLGQEVPFDPRTKALGDDRDAYEALERLEEHLGRENRLELKSMSCRLGRKISVDAKSESITGDAEANGLLTRRYRAPFAPPEKIA